MLALEVGNKIDIQHISSKRSVEIIELAKKMGANVYAEVTTAAYCINRRSCFNKRNNGKG